MKLEQLQYLIEVDNCKSISKAAKKLSLTQPFLSNAITSLEKELGIVIFERKATGVTPNQNGQVVLTLARNIIDNMDHIKTALCQSYSLTGNLKIGLLPAIYNAIVSQLMIDFKQHYPEINLFIQEDSIQGILEGVIDGQYQLGITILLPEEEARQLQLLEVNGIAYEVIEQGQFQLFVGKCHPLYAESSVDISALGQLQLLDYVNAQTFKLLHSFGIQLSTPPLRVYDREIMKKLISQSQMAAILPSFFTFQDYYAQCGLIKGIELNHFIGKINCYLLYPKKNIDARVLSAFIHFIKDHYPILLKEGLSHAP